MRKIFKWFFRVLQVIIIIYVLVITMFIINHNSFGYTEIGKYQFSVINKINKKYISNSKVGDLLVVKKSNDINKGDIIYYYGVYNNHYIVKEGMVNDIEGKGKNRIYTIDKENNLKIIYNKVLGKGHRLYHNIGKILEILESRMGFLFLVLLPIMVIFIYHVFQLFVHIKYDEVDN